MVSSVRRGQVTEAAKRAAVQRVASTHSKTVRISEGQRNAIVRDKQFRAGRSNPGK